MNQRSEADRRNERVDSRVIVMQSKGASNLWFATKKIQMV